MDKIRNKCTKVRMWIILNKGEQIPLWVSKHIEDCTLCREFARDENLIKQYSKISNDSINIEEKSPDIRVKKAIYEVSEKILKKSNKRIIHPLFSPKVGVVIASLAVLLFTFYFPIYGGENYLGYRFNKKIDVLIATLDQSTLLLDSTYRNEVLDNINGLKFMNAYFNNEPYKSFYYSHRNVYKTDLLTVKLFSNLSNKDPDFIYKLIKDRNYAKVCRELKLPYKYVTENFQKFVENSSYLNAETFSIEGIITSVDLINGRIYIDSLYEPIRVDFSIFSEAYPGNYISLNLSNKEGELFALSVSPADFKSTVIKGKLLEVNNKIIKLSTFSQPIYISRETIIKDKEERVSINSILNREVLIRSVIDNNGANAISILTVNKGEERIISGEILNTYKHGFTIKNVNLSFYCSPELNFVGINDSTFIKNGNIITVKGLDYGITFEVAEVINISKVKPLNNNEPVYIALTQPSKYSFKSSSKQNNIETTTETDYIVGINEKKEIFLKSGRTINSPSYKEFPSGAKVQIVTNKGDGSIQSINLVDFGKIQKLSSSFTSYKLINNNVVSIMLEEKTLFIYLEDPNSLPSSGIMQAMYIDYGNFGIVEKMRAFKYSELIDIRGYITKIIDDGKSYLLDNGYILKIDELSEVDGGSLLIGKTINISGILDKGYLLGYIVKISEEYGIISGRVIEINSALNFIKLDSGIVIMLNRDVVYSTPKGSISIGDEIICKVLLIDNQYVAKEIFLANEYNKKVGWYNYEKNNLDNFNDFNGFFFKSYICKGKWKYYF